MKQKLHIIYIAAALLFSQTVAAQSNTPCTAGVITAPNITVGASCNYQSGTTVGATQQTNPANGGMPTCGAMGEDVWYSFTAPASGSIVIQTTAGSITDGVMALYSGTCGAFTQIVCDDDSGPGLMPQISATGLTPGVTYLIRFWDYGGGTGTFNICVAAAAPPAGNTTCTLPSPICSGSPINFVANAGGSSASVINPGNNYDCLFTSPNPSWYYLEIASAGNLVIDITAGADVDYEIWGPFPNLATAIANCNSYGVPQDCSYSPSPIEQAVVNGVAVGQVYVLLVTNFANVVQTININEAAANTASTNCAIVPLPVGYTYWNGELIDDQVVLGWGTEFEDQNRTFFVQRSSDGLIWETIGVVAGQHTSNEVNHYSFTDEEPLNTIAYYRLLQEDTDGSIHIGTVLSVNAGQFDQLTVYPNPSNGHFTVRMQAKKADLLQLTDLVGKATTPDYTVVNGGLEIDGSQLQAGVYTLTVLVNGVRQTSRIIIEK